MYRELCYYIWILWCFFPPLLSCNGLSFPFEVILSDWVFYENTWCMSCRAYLWWQWDTTWFTWCMFWWSTCGFSDIGNLYIGVDARSCLCFSGRYLGALFEVLCIGLSIHFEVILSDRVFKDLRTLDECLACAYLWWQWDITWSTWCMFWWSTCGFRPWTYA